MALIQAKSAHKTEKVKLEIREDILKEIQKYCAWAGIDDMNYFIEESAKEIFKLDSDWKRFKKSEKKETEVVK